MTRLEPVSLPVLTKGIAFEGRRAQSCRPPCRDPDRRCAADPVGRPAAVCQPTAILARKFPIARTTGRPDDCCAAGADRGLPDHVAADPGVGRTGTRRAVSADDGSSTVWRGSAPSIRSRAGPLRLDGESRRSVSAPMARRPRWLAPRPPHCWRSPRRCPPPVRPRRSPER